MSHSANGNPAATDILEVRGIHTFIGQFHILQGVSVGVSEGSITALLGRNGAGKTTTLKSILGLTPPREGQVIFDGQEIQGRRSFDIAAMGIGFVPEHRAIFRDLSVGENLKIAERKKGDLARKEELIFGLFPFTPTLPKSGWYEVRLAHCYNVRRSTKTPVTIRHADGDATVRINQQKEPGHGRLFRSLGTFRFEAGRAGWVRVSNEGTEADKVVIADAVQFLWSAAPKR